MQSVFVTLLVLSLAVETIALYHVLSFPSCREQDSLEIASPNREWSANIRTVDCITSWLSSDVQRVFSIQKFGDRGRKMLAFNMTKNVNGNIDIQWTSNNSMHVKVKNVDDVSYFNMKTAGVSVSYDIDGTLIQSQ